MPTERFNRLPEEKRRVIREAALKEFSRVPYEKASINQIIRGADISRGSFYTYFEDKQDVVEFLLEDQFEQMQRICREALTDSGGDYFAMMEWLFEYFIGESQKAEEMIQVARNIFSCQENTQFLGMGNWPPPGDAEDVKNPIHWVFEKVDTGRTRLKSAADFAPLAMLATSALVFSIKQYYDYPGQLDRIREDFLKSLDILKYGSLGDGEQEGQRRQL